MTSLPRVCLYKTVDFGACDISFTRDFDNEQMDAFRCLFNLPGFMVALQGPHGTGKSFFEYRILLPFLQSVKTRTGKAHQVLIVGPTNVLNDRTAVEMQKVVNEYVKRKFGKPVLVVRLHREDTERKIAWKPASDERRQTTRPDAIRDDGVQDVLNEAAEALVYRKMIQGHYERTAGYTTGISDPRAKEIQLSLGHRMLQKAGIISESWSEPDNPKYDAFRLSFHQYLSSQAMSKADIKIFMENTKILRDDTLRDADVVVCTPFCVGQHVIHSILKPTVVNIDKASQIMEPLLWPLMTYYTAPQNEELNAILHVGDHFQLRPIVTSSAKENPFRSQLRVSLFARLVFAGLDLPMLEEQHRMHPDMADVVSSTYYDDLLRSHESTGHKYNEKARTLREWNRTVFGKQSNLIFVDVQGTQATQSDKRRRRVVIESPTSRGRCCTGRMDSSKPRSCDQVLGHSDLGSV